MRQDVYGVAFQEARSELLDISNRFEQLRQRKEHLEGVVGALGPLLGAKTAPVAHIAEAPKPAPAETGPSAEPSAYTFSQVEVSSPAGDEAISDPFQRRVRNALKFGSLTREREGLQHAV